MRFPAGATASLVVMLVCAPDARAQLQAELYASGFNAPVAFVQDPSRADVQMVVEQGGRIRVVQNGAIVGDFLDLTSEVRAGGEQGLLGLAFAPDYASSGRVFVNFTNRAGGHTVVARFRRSAINALRADPASRFDLMWPDGQRVIPQPFSNHNGGHLLFGPDGYLYIGLGDGGSGDDPMHLAQNPLSLLGKMLRIDVSVSDADARGYRIPPDNPFVNRSGVLPEIWAFGLRNPWRYSFDDPSRGGNGALIIGDVGQNRFEEIDYEPARSGGRNYGWRNREGPAAHVGSLPPFFEPLIEPAYSYAHPEGRSVTAGGIYRGTALGGAFVGRYLFADFVTSRVWSLRFVVDATGGAAATDVIEHTSMLGSAAQLPSSFGIDANGEWYIVSYTGSIHRLVDPSAPPSGNGCAPPDPFAAIGGGRCVDGQWRPPAGRPPCLEIRRVVIGFVSVAIVVPRCGHD